MGVGMEKPIVFILPCDMTIKSIADIYIAVLPLVFEIRTKLL